MYNNKFENVIPDNIAIIFFFQKNNFQFNYSGNIDLLLLAGFLLTVQNINFKILFYKRKSSLMLEKMWLCIDWNKNCLALTCFQAQN